MLGLPVIDAAPMGLLLEAGLRRSEASGMISRRCQPGSGYVKVVGGKGGKDRLVAMSRRLDGILADLEILEGVGVDDHIFYTVKANTKSRRVWRKNDLGVASFDRWWKRCLDQAGVRYRNPHMARHTFATRWLRRGMTIDDLCAQMGHSSIQTTYDLYCHVNPSEVLDRMRALEEAELT